MIDKLLKKYRLTKAKKQEFLEIINPIIVHPEFQKRLKSPFYHHGTITLGEHIIEDAILTYKLAKKDNNTNIELAVIIALFHDLYGQPWQNNKIAKTKRFFNKHGFRHPYEAIINAIVWYPEYFKNENEAQIIIDGVLHHMYPFPIRGIKDFNSNELQLNNYECVKMVDKKLLQIIINSSNRNTIGKLSFAKSKYQEGRLVMKADKKISFKQNLGVRKSLSLVTGKIKNQK